MAYYYSPFRKEYTKKTDGCNFCNEIIWKEESAKYGDGTIVENDHYIWLINFYPKFEGHTIVVPKKHITKIGEETQEAVAAREELIVTAAEALQKLYPEAGIEIFLQTGSGSESSILHLHWHIVPALPDDHLRSFDKLGHFYTIEADKEKVVLFPIKIKLAREELVRALAKFL